MFSHWCEYVIKVFSGYLSESLGHKPSSVFNHLSLGIRLYLQNPHNLGATVLLCCAAHFRGMLLLLLHCCLERMQTVLEHCHCDSQCSQVGNHRWQGRHNSNDTATEKCNGLEGRDSEVSEMNQSSHLLRVHSLINRDR
jgi:hypothetical protein